MKYRILTNTIKYHQKSLKNISRYCCHRTAPVRQDDAFEAFVVVDFWKRFLHFGQMPSLYYLRTQDGLEVDLVIELNQKLNLYIGMKED